MTRTDSTDDTDLVGQPEKDIAVISPRQWEHNILIYCILSAQIDIILLYGNK